MPGEGQGNFHHMQSQILRRPISKTCSGIKKVPDTFLLAENGEQRRFRTADVLSVGRDDSRFGILRHLLGCLKIHVVDGIFVVLALVGGVIAADLRPRLVDPAPKIALQMLAVGVDQKVPDPIIDKHTGAIMQQKPANEIVVFRFLRSVDRQCKIPAADRGAVIAQALSLRNLRLLRPASVDRLGKFGWCDADHARSL